jgi:hypothetical protein
MTPALQHSNSSEDVHAVYCDTSSEAASLPRIEVSKTSTDPASINLKRSADSRNPFSRAARWAALDSGDREVFKVWALRVAAFYSLLITALLVAIQIGTHTPAGRGVLSASPALEPSSPVLPVTRMGSIGK